MQVSRIISRLPLRQIRKFSRCSMYNQNVETQSQIETLTVPPPSNVARPLSPKIESLIEQISNLTLVEVSELSGGLKKRLNLPDAPAFPVGFAPGAVPAADQDDDDEPKAIKNSFTVKLMKYDDKQKVALIKEVKALVEGMNLVQAKKFVEGSPAIVKADVSKEEADKLREALTKVGAEILVD